MNIIFLQKTIYWILVEPEKNGSKIIKLINNKYYNKKNKPFTILIKNRPL